MPENIDGGQGAVIVEQLGRLSDRIEARLKAMETALETHRELEKEKNDNLKTQIVDLKAASADQEARLRSVTDQSTRNQVGLSLASGGSVIASIAALLKAFLGGP